MHLCSGLFQYVVVVLPNIGDIIAYTHGLHFCQEVKAMHAKERKQVNSELVRFIGSSLIFND